MPPRSTRRGGTACQRRRWCYTAIERLIALSTGPKPLVTPELVEEIDAAWRTAMRGLQIAVTPITVLELLYTREDGNSFDLLAADLAQLRNVPITRSVTNAAQRAYRALAHVQPRYHRRVKINDLLIAAAAEDGAVGVLHYDEDFDVLAGVLSFESRWIAPRGSL